MNLQYTEETFYSVNSSDFDKWAEEYIGRNPEIMYAKECGDDSKISILVDGNLRKYDREDLQGFMNREKPTSWSLPDSILNLAAEEGMIPKGKYLIHMG